MKKQLEKLAEEVAKYEKLIKNASDKKMIKIYESKIMELLSGITDLEDMIILDDLILKILKNS